MAFENMTDDEFNAALAAMTDDEVNATRAALDAEIEAEKVKLSALNREHEKRDLAAHIAAGEARDAENKTALAERQAALASDVH